MTSSEYIKTILKPIIARYLDEPTAKDLAFSACILAFHYCEYAARDQCVEKSAIENLFRALGPEFDVIQGVANAAKHTEVKAKKQKHRGLSEADAMVAAGHVFSNGAYFSNGTTFSNRLKTIRVKIPNGRYHDLAYVLPRVLQQIEEYEQSKP